MSTLSPAQTQPTAPASSSAVQLRGAGVMVLLMVFGATNPGNFVMLDRLLNHPLLFLPVVSVLLLASTATARALSRYAKFALVALQLLLLFMGYPLLFLILVTSSGTSTLTEPDGRAYAVVTEYGTDSAEVLSIRQSSGLFARKWDVGCINVEASKSVRWDGPERLIIQSDEGGQVIVTVSPTNGRPVRIQDPGILGC